MVTNGGEEEASVIERQQAPRGQVKLTFTLPAEQVDGQAFVVGDFNEWDLAGTPLRKRGGIAKASVTVPPGRRYAFRYYRRDGTWFNDDTADDYVPNEFGGHNCVIDLTQDGG
jgi:1,4-alpha-glucan branching enzyme